MYVLPGGVHPKFGVMITHPVVALSHATTTTPTVFLSHCLYRIGKVSVTLILMVIISIATISTGKISQLYCISRTTSTSNISSCSLSVCFSLSLYRLYFSVARLCLHQSNCISPNSNFASTLSLSTRFIWFLSICCLQRPEFLSKWFTKLLMV